MNKFSYQNDHRLKNKKDFSYLRMNSKRLTSQDLVLFYCPTRLDQSSSRLGISVTKKSGNAVKRNYLKRVIRNNFRTSDFKNMGCDILVCLKSSSKNFNFDSIDSQLSKLFQKIEDKNG